MILVIVGLLVLSAMGYFASRYFEVKETVESQTMDITRLRAEVTDLEADIVALQGQIDNAQTSLAEKDQLLGERDQRIALLNRKLAQAQQSGSLKKQEISEITNRLTLVQNQVSQYTERIQLLENKVQTQKGTIAEQAAQVAAQESTLTVLNAETAAQAERLKAAQILQAANFAFVSVKKNGKEIEDTAFRRGAVGNMKVCANLLPNNEAPTGVIDIRLAVYGPNDYTRSIPAQAAYKADGQRVCVPFTFAEKPEKGSYETRIYDVDNNLLGKSAFVIK